MEKAATSKEAWDSLCNMFELKSLVNSLFLQQALHNTKFNNGDKTHMKRHIAKLISVAEKLRSIRSLIDNRKVALIILESLPQSYSPLIMRLESQSKTLTLDLVKSYVLHEVKKHIATSKTENAFATEQRYSNFRHGAAQGPSKQYSSSQGCQEKRDSIKCHRCRGPGYIMRNYKAKEPKNMRTSKLKVFISVLYAKNIHNVWLIDSGASQYMTCNKDWLVNYRDIMPVKVYLEDDSIVDALGIGDIEVTMETSSSPISGTFKDVLYVPGLTKNLLSVSKVTVNGVRAFFDVHECQLIDKSGEIVGVTVRDDNLYVVKCQLVINRRKKDQKAATVATTSSPIDTWHQ